MAKEGQNLKDMIQSSEQQLNEPRRQKEEELSYHKKMNYLLNNELEKQQSMIRNLQEQLQLESSKNFLIIVTIMFVAFWNIFAYCAQGK
mmetsp:Transcript_28585/g.27582  ORF Transcript_28585/g.27582 Transcript_28585/m.27582 type:complete len:89 (-) Transcript_28585:706-972(-)